MKTQQEDQNAPAHSECVVLTGSSGCLGFQTLNLLISHDDQVGEIRCLDLVEPSELMKKTISSEVAKYHESKRSPAEKTVKYTTGDIRDINTVERLLDGAHCVIHCAAKTDIWTEPSEQDYQELESINVQGTDNLLRACIRLGVPKFVHVSSFETFVSYHTIYYATESTIPDPKFLLFGASAETKKEAENKVRQYSNNKLKRRLQDGDKKQDRNDANVQDSLRAVIVRFTPIYGPHDKYYVSKLLQIAKFFSGKLQRFTNVWIRQQPIFVGNAAWSLIKAKQRLDVDESISGEDFHITDDTKIGDPFDFVEPFVECRGMQMSKSSYPAWPVWLLIILFSYMRGFLASLDILGLFTKRKSRLDEAIESDHANNCSDRPEGQSNNGRTKATRWYHLITSQTFYFMCNSLFLNRTKASLRLDYEPLFSAGESMEISLNWYKNYLEL